MLSHDLARLLLKRRNNDLKFEVEVAERGSDDGDFHVTDMLDDRAKLRGETVTPENLLVYNPQDDYLLLHLGTVFLGENGEAPPMVLLPTEKEVIRKALQKLKWGYDHVGLADDHPSQMAVTHMIRKFSGEPEPVTDHAYDAGPTKGDHCLYNCGKSESQHARSEYAAGSNKSRATS